MVFEENGKRNNETLLAGTSKTIAFSEIDRDVMNGEISIIDPNTRIDSKTDTNGRNMAEATGSVKDDVSYRTEKASSLAEAEIRPGLLREIFSWRGVIYVLLHLTFITFSLPRTSTNMAFVCINTKRAEVLRLANASSLISDLDVEFEGTMARNNMSGSLSNESYSFWEEHAHVFNDINWDSTTIGLVLSGQLFLSAIGPVVFEAARQKLGSRLVIFIALVCNAVVMVISPVVARTSPYIFLAGQIFLGFTMSGNIPSIGAALSQWTPEKQSLTATTLVYAGYNVGTIISVLVNGFLCSIDTDNGWPFIFYVSGIGVAVFAVVWILLFAESPDTHPFISDRERTYIQTTRAKSIGQHHSKKVNRPPYRLIITSVPVLASTFVFCCYYWIMNVTFVYVPLYLNTVHGFSAELTGVIFSTVPLIRVFGSFTWTVIGNVLTNNGILSQPATRKTCICIGMGVSAVIAAAVSFFDRDDKWVAIALLLVTMFFQAVCTSHVSALPLDLAPRFAGTVASMAMSVALLISLSGPITVSSLTPNGTYSEWRVVWYLMSAVFLSTALVFLIFGQAKLQPWAAIEPERDESANGLEQQTPDMSSAPMTLEIVVPPLEHGSTAVDVSQEFGATQSQYQLDKLNHRNSSLGMSNTDIELNNLAFEADSSRKISHSMLEEDNLAFETDSSAKNSHSKMETDNLAFEQDVTALALFKDSKYPDHSISGSQKNVCNDEYNLKEEPGRLRGNVDSPKSPELSSKAILKAVADENTDLKASKEKRLLDTFPNTGNHDEQIQVIESTKL